MAVLLARMGVKTQPLDSANQSTEMTGHFYGLNDLEYLGTQFVDDDVVCQLPIDVENI
jgi:hypothetical protein